MSGNEHTNDRSFSRRTFFKIVTGSLMAMPATAGGFLVPPTLAYAETLSETDGGSADGVTERIVVVKASEVGFCVLDMADGGETKVPGAYVRITSRYNGKKVEGYTDEDGVVTLEQMKQDMTTYQDELRSKGQTTLADISAEYLEYMISIW